jgi:hypothetical protein
MNSKFTSTLLLAALALGGNCQPTRGAIVVSNAFRSVLADPVVTAAVSDSSSAAGALTLNKFTSGSGGGVQIQIVSASQTSTTPSPSGSTMSGQGRANASYTGGDGATINPVMDSLFDVSFSVDAAGSYLLNSAVQWNGTFQPIDGFASVELRDVTHNTTLALARVNAGQFLFPNPSFTLLLQPGTAYRLVAEAKVFGPPDEFTPLSGDAQWSFNLSAVAVPEAGSMALVGLAATAGSLAAAWRRQRVTK